MIDSPAPFLVALAVIQTPAPLLVALAVSVVVAFAAWRMRSLSMSGAVAATVVGAVAASASYGIGAYVILWFALAAMLSRYGKAQKARRLAEIVEKSSQRDAWQVLANGGVFAGLVGVCMFLRSGREVSVACDPLLIAAAASLAAAGADTWATEIGTLFGGAPWSLRSASRVPAGTSGAITVQGTIALLAGAVTMALLAKLLGLTNTTPGAVAVAAGGVAGAFADTILGAWLQERRWCPRCTMETEQRTHRCGTPTVQHRGLSGLNNDVVNFLCTFIGAATALLLVLA